MIRKLEDQRTENRENVCGGKGAVTVRHFLEASDLAGKASLCGVITIPPGVTFGLHDHTEDAEIYYVLKGEILTGVPGEEQRLKAGDATFTAGGEIHRLENPGTEAAEVLSVIIGSQAVRKTFPTPD